MWALIVAAICAGLFAGAAIYINAVEHPARVSCGNDVALREFAPSYRRATVMQASLAVISCLGLHAVRSVLSSIALVLFLVRLAAAGM